MRTSRAIEFLGGLRLTVACLACAGILVFAGTIAQTDIGVYAAQAKYFRSWVVVWDPPGGGLAHPCFSRRLFDRQRDAGKPALLTDRTP